jgi:hypothetical protein
MRAVSRLSAAPAASLPFAQGVPGRLRNSSSSLDDIKETDMAATVERFGELCEKADKCATEALGWLPSMRGSERGPLQARLAAMWMARATLEHQMLHAQRQETQIVRLRERVKALEAKLGVVEAPFPDPFETADDPPEEGF